MEKMPVRMVKKAKFWYERASWVVIEVSSGAIEIYRVEEEGIEMFKGYISDLKIPGSLRLRACNALYREEAFLECSEMVQLDLGLEELEAA